MYLFRSDDLERVREPRREVDPVVEGHRYGLAPEVSLAIWELGCRDATEHAGGLDEPHAQQRFHDLAARTAARGGQLAPAVGRVTRVGIEIVGDVPTAWSTGVRAPRVPGRTTRALLEAREDSRGGGEQQEQRAGGASYLPGAGSWAQRMPFSGPVLQRRLVEYLGASELVPTGMEARGAGRPLPADVQAKMERALGASFEAVRIHEGPHATALGALAYTQGTDIHFAPGQYDPDSQRGQELLGHELAHVVQQAQGRVGATAHVKGMALNDDAALEREADELGAKAARHAVTPPRASALGPAAGPSSELAASPGADARAEPSPVRTVALQTAIQRRSDGVIQRQQEVATDYGTFKAAEYEAIANQQGLKCGVKIWLEFHPDETKVDATKIGLTQTARSQLAGRAIAINPSDAKRWLSEGPGQGRVIDQSPDEVNPLYAEPAKIAGPTLGSTSTDSFWGQHGWNYHSASGTSTSPAILKDTPSIPRRGINAAQEFETAALAVEGIQADTYMGSVSWGWKVDSAGTFQVLPLTLVSKDIPSGGFMAAAQKWNCSSAQGTTRTAADPTNVYGRSYSTVLDTLEKDTTVVKRSDSGVVFNDVVYMLVNYQGKDNQPKIGAIKVSDLEDQGDGASRLPLPIQWVGTINFFRGMPKPRGRAIYSASEDRRTTLWQGHNAKLAELRQGTRVKVLSHANERLFVEVDTRQTGKDGRAQLVVVLDSTSRDHNHMIRGYVHQRKVSRNQTSQ